MKIAVVGAGYVGLVTAVCLAEVGHTVTCIDIDEEKVKMLQSGRLPIYEEQLEALMKANEKRLSFTSNYPSGIPGAEVIFIAVGTPPNEDGSANIAGVKQAAIAIARNITRDAVVAIKSTVPVGTNEVVKELINSEVSDFKISVAANPEFLREGSAVHDMFYGDRIVIGVAEQETADILKEVYNPFSVPVVETDIRSAEMIKYAANTFLAAKISFINEIANLCEKVGANVEEVAYGIGKDQRIGNQFLNAGIGYGGSCFPKDTKALDVMAREHGEDLLMMKTVMDINERQQHVLVTKALARLGNLQGKKLAVLGLAFKPNTNDVREAPAISIVEQLHSLGAQVRCYDPAAMKNAQDLLPADVEYAKSIEDAIKEADAVFLLTEWNEFKQLPLRQYVALMRNPLLFDGRNCYRLAEVEKHAIEYHSIGRPVIMNR